MTRLRWAAAAPLRRLTVLFIALALCAPAHASSKLFNFADAHRTLNPAVRPDGKKETYYVVDDTLLAGALGFIDEWWSEVGRETELSRLRGHLDNYMPPELKLMRYRPADVLMRRFAEFFFASRNPKTGLIPYSHDGFLSIALTRTGGAQPVYLILRATELARWFPDDVSIRRRLVEFADATIKHFDYSVPSELSGMWAWVDVQTGRPVGPILLTQDVGAVARAMAYVSEAFGRPEYLAWADRKLMYVWDRRLNASLPVLAEQFTPTLALAVDAPYMTSDSDVLYFVRHLFDLAKATGSTTYRSQALAVTDLWFQVMWSDVHQHWVRKMTIAGEPARSDLYGDGKYNTMFIMIKAFAATRDERYLKRLKDTWRGLMSLAGDGLVPESFDGGKRTSTADRDQTMFIEILLDAYEASDDAYFLAEAKDLARRIIQVGPEAMRAEGGQAGRSFLRLALALGSVKRVELVAPSPGMTITLRRDGAAVQTVSVPTEAAVLYMPAGPYQLEVRRSGKSRVIHVPPTPASRLNEPLPGLTYSVD